MQPIRRIKESTIARCFQIFSKADRQKILAVILLQFLLGLLDLLGVALIGIIGALSVTGIQSAQTGNRVGEILNFLHLQDFSFQQQTAILGLFATVVLVGRTLFSIFFTRKVLFFIARRSAVTSGILVRKVLRQNNLLVSTRSIQDTIYSLTSGVSNMNLGVVGTLVTLIADISLLLVMTFGLFVVDFSVAISTVLMFSLVGFGLYRLMHTRAHRLGRENARVSIGTNEMINEVLSAYREATVRNRRSYYAQEIGRGRMLLSNIIAEQSFMPNISKYVVEATMILCAVSISALQFTLQDSKHAIATLAVFLAAGTRIAPAVLRVQQGAILIRTSIGAAKPTLELIDTLPKDDLEVPITKYIADHKDFEAVVEIENVSFKYPKASVNALEEIAINIPKGTSCAIVGPSGSGKTTLVDLILGMFQPGSGQVLVSRKSPLASISKYPGAIGYVPQDVMVFQGSIRQNIALGYPIEDATDERIQFALEIAQLMDFVNELPDGSDTLVGPRGSKLSGGQRQRLGIARAMFTKPKLLILDESTSALDAQTEVAVSEAIAEIPYEITTIIIAHRLSTVRKADQVIYLSSGSILAKGSFDEVRNNVIDFDKQAKLMGL
jgi:ABC-type multidrug transport system fused ATPase/permease subunit